MARPSKGLRNQLNVRLPVDLIAQVNLARGVMPLNDWCEHAFRLALRPHSQVMDTELLQEIHHHEFRPSRTIWNNGQRVKYEECECGMELEIA